MIRNLSRTLIASAVLALALIVSACGRPADSAVTLPRQEALAPAATEAVAQSDVAETESATTESAPTESATTETSAQDAAVVAESTNAPAAEAASAVTLPSWAALPLVNARTGDTFTLADYAGMPVLVEPMATWCTNCRRQLGNVSAAASQLGDKATFVALSVEADLPPDQLAAYAEQNGFPIVFAVVTPEVLTALVDQFGQTITNPPATPHFVIYPDGDISELLTGSRSPADLVALLGG